MHIIRESEHWSLISVYWCCILVYWITTRCTEFGPLCSVSVHRIWRSVYWSIPSVHWIWPFLLYISVPNMKISVPNSTVCTLICRRIGTLMSKVGTLIFKNGTLKYRCTDVPHVHRFSKKSESVYRFLCISVPIWSKISVPKNQCTDVKVIPVYRYRISVYWYFRNQCTDSRNRYTYGTWNRCTDVGLPG